MTEMELKDVPDDLVRAALAAYCTTCLQTVGRIPYSDHEEEARRVLAGALPVYEKQLRERTETAERALAELRERIGKGEAPDSYCPRCGMAMWLDADGLAPLHDHPVNGGRCPGMGRRPSDEWRDGEWKAADNA